VDPGWKPALSGSWRGFMPQLTLRSNKSTLVILRSIWLGAPLSWFLFGSMLWFLRSESSRRPAWVLPAVVVVGTVNVGLAFLVRSRPLKRESLEDLAKSYSAASQVGWAFANAAVFFGLVAFFVGGGFPAYLLSLPFGVEALALMLPTSRNISHFQEGIASEGSSLSLLEALARPYERPQKPRGRLQRPEDPGATD